MREASISATRLLAHACVLLVCLHLDSMTGSLRTAERTEFTRVPAEISPSGGPAPSRAHFGLCHSCLHPKTRLRASPEDV